MTNIPRLKPIISLGNATVQLMSTHKNRLEVYAQASGAFLAYLGGFKGTTAHGGTPQEALANLELALIDAEQKDNQ